MTLQVATPIGPAHTARAAANRTQQSTAQSQTAATGPEGNDDGETSDPSSSFAELIHEISGAATSSPDDAAGSAAAQAPPLRGSNRLATESAELPQLAPPSASAKNPSTLPAQTTHTRSLAAADGKAPKAANEQTAPLSILAITVPAPPVRFRLPVFAHSGQSSPGDTTGAGKTYNHAPAPSAERADTALHVTIRTPEHNEANAVPATPANPSEPATSAAETQQQSDQPDKESKSAATAPDDTNISADVNAVAASPAAIADHTPISVASDSAANIASNLQAAEVSRAIATPLPPPAAAVEVNAKQPDAPSQPAAAPPARSSAPPPEPLSEQANQQPLRSVSLEFTPDGARDVRLRLSERGGEVHVSLHSTDPAFTGRLHEGVHDLIGSLTNAGYDAEAWSPDQGQQDRQRQPADPQKQRRNNAADSGGDDFGGLLTQPIQEVS